MKNSVNVKKILTLTIATLLAIRTVQIVRSSTTLTQNKLNETDFKIKGSGSRMETHGWLSREAGRSKVQNASQIYAYAFVTGKGLFAVMSHGVEDSAKVANDTQWHTHGTTLCEKLSFKNDIIL